jgi:hypothetical protein
MGPDMPLPSLSHVQVLASVVQVQAAVSASGVVREKPLHVVALAETNSAYQVRKSRAWSSNQKSKQAGQAPEGVPAASLADLGFCLSV